MEEENNNGDELTVEELKAQLSKKEEAEKSLVAQLAEQRKRAQEAEEAAKLVAEKKQEEPVTEVEKTVYSVLEKERGKDRLKNRDEALKLFIATHKEYHGENDTTGVHKATLDKALAKLNTQGSYTVEEMLSDLELAHQLSSVKVQSHSILDSHASSPTTRSQSTTDNRLTQAQEQLRAQKGWTVEKYLDMRAKYPMLVP